jgi:hypothetical protein
MLPLFGILRRERIRLISRFARLAVEARPPEDMFARRHSSPEDIVNEALRNRLDARCPADGGRDARSNPCQFCGLKIAGSFLIRYGRFGGRFEKKAMREQSRIFDS